MYSMVGRYKPLVIKVQANQEALTMKPNPTGPTNPNRPQTYPSMLTLNHSALNTVAKK